MTFTCYKASSGCKSRCTLDPATPAAAIGAELRKRGWWAGLVFNGEQVQACPAHPAKVRIVEADSADVDATQVTVSIEESSP